MKLLLPQHLNIVKLNPEWQESSSKKFGELLLHISASGVLHHFQFVEHFQNNRAHKKKKNQKSILRIAVFSFSDSDSNSILNSILHRVNLRIVIFIIFQPDTSRFIKTARVHHLFQNGTAHHRCTVSALVRRLKGRPGWV